MKVLSCLSIILLCSLSSFGQHNLIDNFRAQLKKEKTDTGKAIILYNLSSAYQIFKPDSALLLAQEAYSLSTKHKFLKGESWALNQMAGAFNRVGNYTQALKYYIQQLKIEEQRGFADNAATVYMNIALVYNSEKDADNALFYMLKADSIIRKNNFSDLLVYSLLNLGDISEKANKLPEALAYTKQCYDLSVKNNDSIITGTALNNLGNIYSKMNDVQQAVNSYEAGIPYLTSADDNNNLSECILGLAKEFEKEGLHDSALHYAIKAYNVSDKNGFLYHALDAGIFLSQLYKNKNKIDSAYAYQQISSAIKDSIQSIEKVRQLESITIEEELRQKQIAEQLEQDKKDRREKLQLLAIGIFIPVFFLLSIYISRKKVHSRIIEFSGIVSLLLLFEYITLLIHPFVAEKTNHSPVLEIIIFVAIAALITPTHHRTQKWLLARLSKIHEAHRKPHPLPVAEVVADEENVSTEPSPETTDQ